MLLSALGFSCSVPGSSSKRCEFLKNIAHIHVHVCLKSSGLSELALHFSPVPLFKDIYIIYVCSIDVPALDVKYKLHAHILGYRTHNNT